MENFEMLVSTPEEATHVQQVLFVLGVRWLSGSKSIMYANEVPLILSVVNSQLTYSKQLNPSLRADKYRGLPRLTLNELSAKLGYYEEKLKQERLQHFTDLKI